MTSLCISYPRRINAYIQLYSNVAGTTMLREILWLVQNDIDLEGSRSECVSVRAPTAEFAPPETGSHLAIIKKMKRPRMFMSHSPFFLMGKQILTRKPRVIVIMRNPKDVLVSTYFFMNSFSKDFANSFEDCFELFKAGYLLEGGYFEHVLGYWAHRDKPNFLFLKYEDILDDPHKEIESIAKFLGKSFTAEEIQKIVHATGHEQMKVNPGTNLSSRPWVDQSVSAFHRKGKVGDWKNYLTEEQNQYIDLRCKNELEPVGLKFCYEI